jgi:hypothetical protein
LGPVDAGFGVGIDVIEAVGKLTCTETEVIVMTLGMSMGLDVVIVSKGERVDVVIVSTGVGVDVVIVITGVGVEVVIVITDDTAGAKYL